MSWSLENCSWLPPASKNFSAACRSLSETPGDLSAELIRLSKQALNINQLLRLSTLLTDLQSQGRPLSQLSSFRLGLVSNATTTLITPALIASALRYGIGLQVVEADFGQVAQEALDPNSRLNQAQLDALLLALDHRGLPFSQTLQGDMDSILKPVFDHYRLLLEQFGKGGNRTVIVQTLSPPVQALFGSFENRVRTSLSRQIMAFNQFLTDLPESSGTVLLDVATMAARVGLDQWHDPLQWHMAKIPFSQRLVPLYAEQVARLLGAIRGKSRKCLVLDLDNTLWGGVIGDDGLAGIALGQGSAMGEAFLEIQKTVLNLRDRGIVLAVCSKNEEAAARLPFQEHPEMLLKESHIAVFKANWIDKASNLEQIAQQLNIGLDALVFLDDNPVERAQVREALPLVAVPELPDDPALYSRVLLSAGYFESVGFTADDRQRADQYQANAERSTLQGSARSLDDFLQSLQMVARFAPFQSVGRSRIVQLINKTNQFNLTTRRYTEAQILAMESDSSVFTLQVWLRDRFGDNGMISVVICRRNGSIWEIDSWLMSCRVLKRRVEERVLQVLVEAARKEGVGALRGCWIPSGRNNLVRNHYAELGFEFQQQRQESTDWLLPLSSYLPTNPPIQVEG
ncbi:MAG: HAD family hydrolase [Magnetococcales bacterium]|nr:HAD family hydrolase [Magnetococcales bacterium]